MTSAWTVIVAAVCGLGLGHATHATTRQATQAATQAATPAATQPTPERWDGEVSVGRQRLSLVFQLVRAEKPEGKLEIPTQGLAPTPVKDLILDGDKVTFTLAAPGMPEAAYPKFDLTLSPSTGTGSGTMLQGMMRVPVNLKLLKPGEAGGPKRPQNPTGTPTYSAREVIYDNPESGGKLAGTLTIPEAAKFGNGPYPAAILITGSGPQDRDETLLGHKPFLVIADDLTKRGIAVLRVDDRGVGGSTSPKEGKDTTDDFVTDVLAGIAFLKTQGDIDQSRIGLIGHSEGGVIAPMVAARSKDVAAIALLAGTGVPGRQVLDLQMTAMLKASGVDGERLDAITVAQGKVLELAAGHAEGQVMDDALRELLTAQTGSATEQSLAMARSQMNSPWMRRFLVLDPKTSLSQVTCPVLVMNGGLDKQVLASQNVPAIVQTLLEKGNTDVSVHVFPKLNHLFQTATTGSMAEYGQIEETFAPAALEVLGRWMTEKLRVTGPK